MPWTYVASRPDPTTSKEPGQYAYLHVPIKAVTPQLATTIDTVGLCFLASWFLGEDSLGDGDRRAYPSRTVHLSGCGVLALTGASSAHHPLFDPLNLVLEDGIFVTQLTSFYVLYGN